MTRLIVVVEGQTEESFVNSVLRPHLALKSVFASATVVGKLKAQERGHRCRGGGRYADWRKDLRRLLEKGRDPDLRVTTMFDLYGLPEDFPGIARDPKDVGTAERCARLEAALGSDIGEHRLVPYIQRHEFEALVIAAHASLREVLTDADQREGLAALIAEIGSQRPEDVNEGPQTAPSKRLTRCIPGYGKLLHGPPAIEKEGLSSIREQCPRFDAWVTRLESI